MMGAAMSATKALKCSQVVRRIPLERFRLTDDGARKWKHVAERRKSLLVTLSTYANGDGTFVGEAKGQTRNYSPSALRANISETVLVLLINEQGEKEKGRDEREFSWCCSFPWGFGWRGTERRRA